MATAKQKVAAGAIPHDYVPKNELDLRRCLKDPEWRLFSGYLYKIMVKSDDADDDGEGTLIMPFKPNRAQRRLLKRMWYRNIILKARQLGFTTFVCIFFLDCALFRSDVRCGIVAHTEQDAKTIFRDKVKFAYNRLPESLRRRFPLVRDSQEELLFAHNNSSIRVSTSMRSGTIHYLHVSEFGKICAKHPDRAAEVVTGSIPAVPDDGMLFIESTAEGKAGDFYKMCEISQRNHDAGKRLTRKQLQWHFYPWWDDMHYRIDPDETGITISKKEHEYFDNIEAEMHTEIDIEQRAWWIDTRDSLFAGDESKMWQEYPSSPKEAFQKSTEGCYYSVQMTRARKEGRIGVVPFRPGIPVDTYWDIGSGDGCAVWFRQKVGARNHFINFIEAWGESYEYFVQEMQKMGYVWGTHYLPHDGNHVRQGESQNLTPKEMIENLGLRRVEIVPRVSELQHGINRTRDALATSWFDEENCKEGIDHLDNYRKKWSDQTQTFTDQPLKDVHTEAADAFRQFAQASFAEPEEDTRPKRKRRRPGAMAV